MTSREKNLLIVLGLALFIILNFVAYSTFYAPIIKKAAREKRDAESKLRASEMTLSRGGELDSDIQWLERSGTATDKPISAQTKLNAELQKQARSKGVEVLESRILPFQTGQHFTRVRVICKVRGTEREVFSWFALIHRTNQRQVITKMELKPMKTDLTKVECEVEVEKWIIVSEDV